MNFTTLAVLVLSVLNISLAVINLINTSHSDTMLDQIYNITEKVISQIHRLDAQVHRLDAQDKAIRELDERIDGETDVITRLIDDHRKLKNYAERTHLIALYAYNAVKKSETEKKNNIGK